MLTSESWRERAAAVEGASLLGEDAFASAMDRAQTDLDVRVRALTAWARDRHRERHARDHALNMIEKADEVRTAAKWGQALVQIGDDWAIDLVGEMGTRPTVRPAMRAWLKHVAEETKKRWRDKTRRQTDRLRWELG